MLLFPWREARPTIASETAEGRLPGKPAGDQPAIPL